MCILYGDDKKFKILHFLLSLYPKEKTLIVPYVCIMLKD